MRLVHRNRAEPSLPQMARPALPCIDVAGIMAMDIAEGSAQPVSIPRHGDDVDMVGHQAIAPDLDMGPAGRFGEQVEIELIIPIFEEGLLAPVTALRVKEFVLSARSALVATVKTSNGNGPTEVDHGIRVLDWFWLQ